jgi:hypothetical protein
MANPFASTYSQRFRDVGGAEMCMSAVLHGALLFMFATAMASLDASERDTIARDDVAAMRGYLRASAERGEAANGALADAPGEALSDGRPGLGDPSPARAQASARRDDRAMRDGEARDSARESALREAATWGAIGLLSAGSTPGVDWDRPTEGGRLGSLWGGAIDGSDRFFGLGSGEGGGGRGEGISVGGIGTIGRCRGGCGGTGSGYGVVGGHGIVHGEHHVRSISVRCGEPVGGPPHVSGCATQVNGRLPPEVIQRIVRQNHGRFRLCYEAGLKDRPELEGRVATKFVIGRDGAVAMASEDASDLPASVSACVVRAFSALSFPQPEGGIVTVVYPLVFSHD